VVSMHPESYAGRGHALVKHSGHSPPSNIFLVLRKHTFSRGDGGLMDQWRSIAEKASRQCVCLTQAKAQWRVGKTLKIHPTQRTSEKVHPSESVRIDEKVHHTGI
jgi:hypothetical protein